jgi:hypothetical protein
MSKGTVFLCPILNTMGPVKDKNHADLLYNWKQIDRSISKYYKKKFRDSFIDKNKNKVTLSYFPISWSGFRQNPVKRKMGWFSIFDYLHRKWGKKIKLNNDGVYWMYNHPDKSGIANKWGLDWNENYQYLNILNKFLIDRNFFPSAIQIPTADLNSMHFVDQYFPFELSNRSSNFINWENIEADGRKTKEILKWSEGYKRWSPYRPNHNNHQKKGRMKHYVFRLLDIKTRIMEFPKEEIEKAFKEASKGKKVILCGYEHDFRDRCQAVLDNFILPSIEVSKKYKNVDLINQNFFNAAKLCVKSKNYKVNSDDVSIETNESKIIIKSKYNLFNTPYIAVKEVSKKIYFTLSPLKVSKNIWIIDGLDKNKKYKINVTFFLENFEKISKNFIYNLQKIKFYNVKKNYRYF